MALRSYSAFCMLLLFVVIIVQIRSLILNAYGDEIVKGLDACVNVCCAYCARVCLRCSCFFSVTFFIFLQHFELCVLNWHIQV